MKAEGQSQKVLAVDAGVRTSGWAVFQNGSVEASGVVALRSRNRLEPEVRIDHLMASLDDLAGQWQPQTIVLGRPEGINCPAPALDLLNHRLSWWSSCQAARMAIYTAKAVRAAITGQSNPSRDLLGYGIMRRLGLIGEIRATREWEAIALGHYHLAGLA